MDVTETNAEGLKREFKITVDAGTLDERLRSRLEELKGTVHMKGFRPGKVPTTMLKKLYGKNLMGEILEQTVQESSQNALEERSLRPAMQPNIEIIKFEEGSDLEYKMDVELMPEFDIMDFSKLSLTKQVAEIDDADVDEMAGRLAAQQKAFEEKGEGAAAEEGDAVVMDFTGSVDGEEFEGGKAEDYQIVLGDGNFIPGFENQLVGSKAGESLDVNVTFPEDYGAENLAGKDAVFAVTVKAVKASKDVEVDDEFAQRMGLENLEKLKEALRQQIEQDYQSVTRNKLKRELLDKLADAYDFGVPPGLVDSEFEQIWGQFQNDLERQGRSIEDEEKSEEDLKEEYRGIAERRVRLGLLLAEVGRVNNIMVTQDELNRAIGAQARQFPGQEQALFNFYQQNPQALAQIRAPLFEDKVVDFVLELADVKDETVDKDTLFRDPDEAADESGAAKTATKKSATKTARKSAKKTPKKAAKKASGKTTAKKSEKKAAAKKGASKSKDETGS